MTSKKNSTIIEQLPERCKQDAHYVLYKQADAAKRAVTEAVESDWESANVDKITLTINGKDYAIGLWSGDVIGSLDQFLEEVKDYAANELQQFANSIK